MSDSLDLLRYFTVPTPWAHQVRGVAETIETLKTAASCTLCCGTGGGKTIMAMALINYYSSLGMKCSFFTNRKLLTAQTSKNFAKGGIEAGVRAASLPEQRNLELDVQISSMQSEISWCGKYGYEALHKADFVIIDEAHMMASGGSLKIIKQLLAIGAKVVLLTATPIGLSHITPNLIVAAQNSELRQCGALVPAIVKCLHEMDCSRVRKVKHEYDMGDFVKRCWSQAIVGYVYEDWKRFNPDSRMTLVFAPSVPESIGLAHRFHDKGVPVAHIDAKQVYVDGELSNDDAKGTKRNTVMERWRSGELKVVFNCEVLREGIDVTELFHLILARPLGSFKDYVQTVGRVLRRSDATPDNVLITDHCGNVWNHLSPNANIDWHELYAMEEKEIVEKLEARRRDAQENETPVVCPKCGTTVRSGGKCPPPPMGCGESIQTNNPNKIRFVYQQDGELITLTDKDLAPKGKREKKNLTTEQRAWNQIFWAAKKSNKQTGMTFSQARGLFFRRIGKPLPRGLPLTPKHDLDWNRRIRDVDFRDLVPDRSYSKKV